MHESTKNERERINNIIHDFCRGETMIGVACAHCPIDHLNVCNESIGGAVVPMDKLREAEKILLRSETE